jgi:hypothetical protein
MDRSSWAAISKDSEIWKKIGVGTASLAFILTAPLALGLINTDLETEARRIHEKQAPGNDHSLPSADNLARYAMDGIGPAMLFAAALMMFAIATIPVGLAAFQLYAFFRPPNELAPELHQKLAVPITSLILYFLIGAAGMAVQAVIAASFPVSLAQYARGKDLRPALAVLPNAMTVLEMGFQYWLKAAGVAIGLMAMTVIFITGGFGFGFIVSTLVWLVISATMFVSLVLSSRFALSHVAAELPLSSMAPLSDLD